MYVALDDCSSVRTKSDLGEEKQVDRYQGCKLEQARELSALAYDSNKSLAVFVAVSGRKSRFVAPYK